MDTKTACTGPNYPSPEDRHRRGHDLRARGVQLARGRAQRRRSELPADWRVHGPDDAPPTGK